MPIHLSSKAAVGALCACAFSLAHLPAAAADKVKVGLVSTLSGPSSALGVDIRDGFSVLVNQEEHSKAVEDVARTIVGDANTITRTKPKMGSEDFADMLHAVPGAYFWVGHEGSVPVHNPGYYLDDKILPIGASMLARIVETRLPV